MNRIKKEILKHLRRKAGRYLLTEPHLLYLTENQSSSYLKAMKNPRYAKGFHSETVEIISKNLDKIFGEVNERVALIDLGPGFPDKSLPIAKYFGARGVKLNYIPVDVSRTYLRVASHAMKKVAHRIHPVHSRFENCAEKIPRTFKPVFVMLGLTFMNFDPKVILKLLRRMTHGGHVLVASELLNRENTKGEVLNKYRTREAREVAFGPLRVLGVRSSDVKYDVRFSRGRVEMSFEFLGKPPQALLGRGLRRGDTVVTAVSYRYSRVGLIRALKEYFPSVKIFLSQNSRTALAVCGR